MSAIARIVARSSVVAGMALAVGPAVGLADTPGTSLMVSPNTNLNPAGQSVSVSGTGFGPSGSGSIQQCIPVDDFGTEECSDNIGTFTTNASGVFGPVNVTVSQSFVAAAVQRTCSVTTPCALFATMNAQPQNDHAPIAFASPAATLRSLPAVIGQSTNFVLGDSLPTPFPFAAFSYGSRPQVPIMGDWDADGTRTPGAYRGGTFYLNNENDGSPADITFAFGNPRGFPVVGDYNGDRSEDVAVYRFGLWQVRLSTGATYTTMFGAGTWPATVPVAGDWDGNGTDGIGTYTYATATWALRNNPTGTDGADVTFVFGTPNASYPVPGDWDANGTDTVGVRTGTTWDLRNSNPPGPPEITLSFGAANDLPLTWRTIPIAG